MPSGWFKEDWPFAGHPHIRAFVYLPRFNALRRVEFLVDTGCGVTTLHPTDSLPMGLNFELLQQGNAVLGVGGSQTEYTEEAEVSFLHGTAIVAYHIPIDIAPVLDHNRRIPSLLGMDIIQHWRMICDVHNATLDFEVHHADDVRRLGTTP